MRERGIDLGNRAFRKKGKICRKIEKGRIKPEDGEVEKRDRYLKPKGIRRIIQLD